MAPTGHDHTPLKSEEPDNRYYDLYSGQFLSVDPLVAQTNQPYEYANDDPVNQGDPDGLAPFSSLPGQAVQQVGRAVCAFLLLCSSALPPTADSAQPHTFEPPVGSEIGSTAEEEGSTISKFSQDQNPQCN